MTRHVIRRNVTLGLPLARLAAFASVAALLGAAVALTETPADAGTGATLQTNSCVECHQRAETVRAFPAWARDQITHWYGTVHSRAGVTCEQCHGGNPRAFDADEAHRGVESPRKTSSPLNYRQVPELCAKCHKEVYQNFTQSHHFELLKEDHLAPSCTTCHGFQMDLGAVTPVQLVARCTLCHNENRGLSPQYPDMAREALEGSAQVRHAIERARIAVSLAREQKLNPTVAQALLENAELRLKRTGELWHRFELERFTNELKEIQDLADKAYVAATQLVLQQHAEAQGASPAPEAG